MSDNRVEVIKLQGEPVRELFTIVFVSGLVDRQDQKIHSSQQPLTEREVKRVLRKGGLSDEETTSLLHAARRNFYVATPFVKRSP